MELSNDIQDVLKTIKNLKDKYDIQQHPRDSIGRSSVTSDEVDADEDLIDVDAIDMSDEETWLCPEGNTSSNNVKDIYKWLRQDLDGARGTDFTVRKIMLEREIGNLDKKMKANIDSRTFTRPKKKFSRPSIDNVVDERKGLSFNEDDDFVQGRLNFLSKLNKSDDRKSGKFNLHDVESDNETVSQIMGNFKKTLNISQSEDANRHILPNSLRELIREQTLELESSRKPRFVPDEPVLERKFRNPFENVMESSYDSFQNMSPPSLVSSFASINFNSLTESDFITAMNQPQDLYQSFTSTVASDVGEDIAENEDFARNIKEMHETFTKDVTDNVSEPSLNTTMVLNEKPHDATVVLSEKRHDATIILSEKPHDATINEKPHDATITLNEKPHDATVVLSEKPHDATIILTEKPRDMTMILNKKPFDVISNEKLNDATVVLDRNPYDTTVVLDRKPHDVTFTHTDYFPNTKDLGRDSGPESLNVTYRSNENRSFDTFRVNKSAKDRSGISEKTFSKSQNANDTFIKVPSLEEIRNDNITFVETSGSTESLNTSDGSCSDHGRKELDRLVRMQEQSLQPVASTPLPNRTFVKPAWASTEMLDEPDREPKRSISSTHSSPARKAPDETAAIPKAMSTPRLYDQRLSHARAPDQEFIKPEVRPPKAQLRPTMIVKPLEMQRRTNPAPQQEPAIQQPRVSMLRQPASRLSALPRPAGTGIPRPASRLPAPRTLKPPSTGLPKPSIRKNNWMDGCY